MAADDTFVPIAWRNIDLPLTKILTRNFCLPRELPHYDFCEAYFKFRSIEALNKCAYTKWLPRKHTDYFINYPSDLQREPIWWELPWGGFNKININVRIEELRNSRLQSCRDYLNLLNSIQKNGFDFDKGPLTPIHLLISGNNYMAIQHGSHHRLVALQYLIDKNYMKLIKNVTFNKNGIPLVPCSVNLIIDKEDLNQMETVGNSPSQFSLKDANKWFDLCFDLINQNSNVNQDYSTDQILDSLESLLN
ncbi:hypothetical protein [Synechococcus sp. GEYO]|uniref:hypothetical protein n=1 Tax=Synechococcus sp. GEYO TaxID=2575511 RepID=UPI0010BD0063|nr:hypothetical protein [Synechococcus sp. GEYO]